MRAEDNELLTRTGPGTPMGEFMRQYWIPAMMSEELEAGGAPVRLRLLGENFIAFRSPSGEVGVIDHRCPHRCASLFYGRNEEAGIRCVYHGWKFDTAGQCIDQPSEPPETQFKDKVRLKAAKITERYGVIWCYLGPREEPPPFPEFDIDQIPEEERKVQFMFRECNWLQAFEGDIDTVHVGFLHAGGISPDEHEPGSRPYLDRANRAPKYEAIETPYGAMYTAYRPAGEGETYHRVGQFAFPFYTMAPPDPIGTITLRAWVPVDDENSMLFTIFGYRQSVDELPRGEDGEPLHGLKVDVDYLPNTTDWYGRWRLTINRRNDHLISREMQQKDNYTGIEGIPQQDHAITESMGPIVDRTHERLGTSDQMIVRTRRRLITLARALHEKGTTPPVVDEPEAVRGIRPGHMVIPDDDDWLDVFNRHRQEWVGDKVAPIVRQPSRVRQTA